MSGVMSFTDYLNQRTQGWIDLVLYFIFFFPGVIALAFYGYEYAASSIENKRN